MALPSSFVPDTQMGSSMPSSFVPDGVAQPPAPSARAPWQNNVDAAGAGINQIGSGFKQIFSAPQNPSILGGMYDMASGGAQAVAGGLNTIFSPIGAAIKGVADIPAGGGKNVGDRINQFVINPIADKVSDVPLLQKITTGYPGDIVKDAGNAITIGLALTGGEKAKEIKTAVEPLTEAITPKIEPPGPDGGGGGGVFSRVKSNAIDTLEAKYDDWLGNTKTGVKKINAADSRTAALDRTGTDGQTPQRVLAENKIVPEVEGTKFRTAEQAKQFREDTLQFRQANRDSISMVGEATGPVQLSLIEERAIQMAKSDKNIAGGTASDLERGIRQEFSDYRTNYKGDAVQLTTVDDIATARQQKVKFDFTNPLKGDINYYIGKSARTVVEETASRAGYDSVAQFNRFIGDRFEAAKMLESMDGNTVKGGRLGKYTMTILGSTLGKSIPGKILGALGGEAVAQKMIEWSVSNPIRNVILNRIKIENPAIYPEVVKWIADEQAARGLDPNNPGAARMRLPAPAPQVGAPADGPMTVQAGAIRDQHGNITGYNSGTGDIVQPRNIPLLPARAETSPQSTPMYVTPGGKASSFFNEAQDIGAVEQGQAKQPQRGKPTTLPGVMFDEPYVNPKDLPTIKMGAKGRTLGDDLPVVDNKTGKIRKNPGPKK